MTTELNYEVVLMSLDGYIHTLDVEKEALLGAMVHAREKGKVFWYMFPLNVFLSLVFLVDFTWLHWARFWPV